MADNAAGVLDDCVVEAFRRNAVRSVVLVDEQFPNVGDVLDPLAGLEEVRTRFPEVDKACAIYKAMIANGLLCDISNRPDDWRQNLSPRIANSDLIVLDLHLNGGVDTADSIGVLRHLAGSPRFNLVIVYTNEPLLSVAARTVAGSLRAKGTELSDNLATIFPDVQSDAVDMDAPVAEMIDSFLLDSSPFTAAKFRTFRSNVANRFRAVRGEMPRLLEELVRRSLLEDYGCTFGTEDFRIINADFDCDCPWIVFEHLFVCFANKQRQLPSNLLSSLDASLIAWNPGLPRTLVSQVRNTIARRGYEFGAQFPGDSATQVAWVWHATVDSHGGRSVGSRQLLRRMLSAFQEKVIDDEFLTTFAERMLGKVPKKERQLCQLSESKHWCGRGTGEATRDQDVLHALNTFQSTRQFTGQHVTTGTVLRRVDGGVFNWLVCVEPACDTVPEQVPANQRHLSCRMLELEKCRPETAPDIIRIATQSRHLFLLIDGKREYFSTFNSHSDQPRVVQSVLQKESQLLQRDGKYFVEVRMLNLRGEASVDASITYEVVAQLLEPYAIRLLHITGQHLSRIGLDFVSIKDGLDDQPPVVGDDA